MTRILPVLLLIGVAAGGCANQYEIEQQRKALEVQNIPPVNYTPDLLAFMRTYLNNPANVREAAISEPQKITVIDIERYAACVRYNAKDSSGRYLGSRDHLAIFVSGKFDRLIELGRTGASPDAPGSERLRPLRDYCAAAVYKPFPELEQLRR